MCRKIWNYRDSWNSWGSAPPVFNNNARSGYFKIELASPKIGFGHDDYAIIYTKAVTQNAQPKNKEEEILYLVVFKILLLIVA